MTINVNVTGARNNQEIEAMVMSGVNRGLAQYDQQLNRTLPRRIDASNARYA